MAFLDNAGDIILDAVLTDAGRQRLARGNFKIVKFALGDEEINYELFNSSHPSGSAFYDLEVMQTPILEAFTNNTSLMKSKLISINRNNILYMPVLKVNDKELARNKFYPGFDGYYITADEPTSKESQDDVQVSKIKSGIFHGPAKYSNGNNTRYISVDQGIVADGNTDGLSVTDKLPADMLETAYLVRMDHRLLRIHSPSGGDDGIAGAELINQFVDDDAVATYFLAMADGTNTVLPANDGLWRGDHGRDYYTDATSAATEAKRTAYVKDHEMFSGPLGTVLRFIPKVAPSVEYSATLFDKLGSSTTDNITILDGTSGISNHKYIDTSINITGVTTGYSVDLPIRIIKGTF